MKPFLHYFNWVDYVIVGIIFFSVMVSIFRGFAREAVSLIIWVAGVVAAFKFSPDFQSFFLKWTSSANVAYILAFCTIFGVIFLFGILINYGLHHLIKKTGLTLSDCMLGFCFGLARGILIVGILLMFVSVGQIKDGSDLAQSKLASHFKPLTTWLDTFLPEKLKRLSHWIVDDPSETFSDEGD